MSFSRLLGSFSLSSRQPSFYTSADEEEMKIENSFAEIAQSFEKGVLVICLGLSLDSNRHKFSLEQLQDLYDVILTNTSQEMKDSITKNSHKPCHLILSEPKDEIIVKEMSDFPSVHSINIISKNSDMKLKWIKASPKAARIEKTLEELSDSLQTLISKLPKSDSPMTDSFQMLFLNENGQPKNPHDPVILRIAKLKEYLNFNNRHLAETHFSGFARTIYKRNQEIDYLEKLEDGPKTLLFLYSKQNTLYKLLNYSLKHENLEAIKCVRLILKNLKLAIQENFHSNLNKFSGLLYKGAFINDTLWQEYSDHIGQEIQIPEFFTANKQPKPTHEFLLRPNNDEVNKKTLMTIIMPSCISRKEEGFAEIDNSDEVIFNLNSKFSVLQATSITIQERQFHHLVLVYSQKKIQQAIQEAKPVIVIPKTALFQKICTQCQNPPHEEYLYLDLTSSGESQKFICNDCLKQDPEKSPLLCVSPYLHQLSTPDVDQINKIKIYAMAEDCKEAKYIPFYGQKCSQCQTATNIKHLSRCLTCCDKQWCQDCAVECQRKCVVTGHEIVVERSAYRFWTWTPELVKISQKIKLEQAKKEEEVGIHPDDYDYADENIIKYYSRDEQISIAKAYSNLALKYSENNKFDTARKYSEKAQVIRNFITQNKPHPLQILSFNELAEIFKASQNLGKAQEYFNKALSLSKNIYGNYHSKTIHALANLETVYVTSEQYLKALETHLEILKIKTLLFSEESNEFAVSCERLASLYNLAQQPEKAAAFNLRASQIYQSQPLDQSKILSLAQCFQNLADTSLQEERKDSEEVITNYNKALEYYSQLTEGDPNLPLKIHKALGKIYQEAKDYENVILHSLKELELSKIIYGTDGSQKIANIYQNLGVKYATTKQYDKAVEMYLQAVNLQITLSGENSKEVKNLYKSVADVYYYQNNTELENEYRNKV